MDFDQGKITKIHDYCMNFDQLKLRLKSLSDKYPSGVIIPIHERDLENPQLQKMAEELNQCDYLKKIFVALSANTDSNYKRAVKFSESLTIPNEVLWCNKPEVTKIIEELDEKGLHISNLNGKGKDLWIAMGIASLELYAFAIHDADILSYSRMLPTKLLYSVVEPRMDFFFSKGYYARLSLENRRMYGRIYRLFINPLLDALQKKLNHSSTFIRYLRSFSYPLSGEIAIYSDLAMNLRIPGDWGLEIGMLAELFRNASSKRICEVDLGFYDHKHKEIDQNSLLKTAEDGFNTLLRTLTETEGIDVSEAFLLSLQVIYKRFAQDRIRQYHADAVCNSLEYDRHEEETNVDLLAEVIMRAGRNYLAKPTGVQLPDWLRTISAMPDAKERLRRAAIEN
jgi:glucosyl-3-phosphoglycerate synthase